MIDIYSESTSNHYSPGKLQLVLPFTRSDIASLVLFPYN